MIRGVSEITKIVLSDIMSGRHDFLPDNMETQCPLRARSSVGRVVKDRREGMQGLLASEGKIIISPCKEMRLT